MHITITLDTHELTDHDRALFRFLGGSSLTLREPVTGDAGSTEAPSAVAETAPKADAAKPKRTRRTNQEIAFDAALEAHQADPTDATFDALGKASEELQAKDPGNDRLNGFDLAYYQNPEHEATTDSENAESEQAAEPEETPAKTADVSPEDVKQLAAQLITENRPKAIELLKEFGVAKFSELKTEQLGAFATAVRSALK